MLFVFCTKKQLCTDRFSKCYSVKDTGRQMEWTICRDTNSLLQWRQSGRNSLNNSTGDFSFHHVLQRTFDDLVCLKNNKNGLIHRLKCGRILPRCRINTIVTDGYIFFWIIETCQTRRIRYNGKYQNKISQISLVTVISQKIHLVSNTDLICKIIL